MKRGFAICLVLCGLFIFAGCEKEGSKYEETMKEYATNYYNAVLKGTEGLTSTVITIEQLQKAVDLKIVDFDMSKLSDCDKKSSVELIINQSNNEVSKINYNLQCKK